MIILKNISRKYGEVHALNEVNLTLANTGFVSVLGQSGSGKTTLMNIISGLDSDFTGELTINNRSTSNFNSGDWDSYRNNYCGLIFQSYHLIPHITVLKNVAMSMTLSGVSKEERLQKAAQALTDLGLKDHMHKKPSQLSGGQAQRVAIARALVNDPQILLADEPTGALDSESSLVIMDILKEIAKTRLVVMVTHNRELAETYSERIIELKDGKILKDSTPAEELNSEGLTYSVRKTAMSLWTALSLSASNVLTKKGRTLLTSFAASIGIIGISIVLALSNGFQKQIDNFEQQTLGNFPITVNAQAMDLAGIGGEVDGATRENTGIFPFSMDALSITHNNNISPDFINFLEDNLDETIISGLGFVRAVNLNLAVGDNPISSNAINLSALPRTTNLEGYMDAHFDLLAGGLPTSQNELLLQLDEFNNISDFILRFLDVELTDNVLPYEEVIGRTLTVFGNDVFYAQTDYGFTITDLSQVSSNGDQILELEIVGVVRPQEASGSNAGMMSGSIMNAVEGMLIRGGVLAMDELFETALGWNAESAIVGAQFMSETNVFTGEHFNSPIDRMMFLASLGADVPPMAVNIFPLNFESKDVVTDVINDWNMQATSVEETIIVTDLAALMISLSGGIMSAITNVLIAFSGVSLIVSGIMVSLVTWVSTLERTKEIGILRALGARRKDVKRIFNAETFIIGAASGLIGVGSTFLLTFPINDVLYRMTELENVAVLHPLHALAMVGVAVAVTMIGGAIPSRMASKKDPVVALRDV